MHEKERQKERRDNLTVQLTEQINCDISIEFLFSTFYVLFPMGITHSFFTLQLVFYFFESEIKSKESTERKLMLSLQEVDFNKVPSFRVTSRIQAGA